MSTLEGNTNHKKNSYRTPKKEIHNTGLLEKPTFTYGYQPFSPHSMQLYTKYPKTTRIMSTLEGNTNYKKNSFRTSTNKIHNTGLLEKPRFTNLRPMIATYKRVPDDRVMTVISTINIWCKGNVTTRIKFSAILGSVFTVCVFFCLFMCRKYNTA
jgi:hypothetical protein